MAFISAPSTAGSDSGRLLSRMATRGDQRVWLVQMTETELDQLRQMNVEPSTPPECRNRT
ncbi:protein of unknown function (plasmid) [Rhodovastum atsumiense]|nr:protein of unknown function [Rhodovastum atsumiense]